MVDMERSVRKGATYAVWAGATTWEELGRDAQEKYRRKIVKKVNFVTSEWAATFDAQS